jgi:hypothetical protein
MKSILSLFSICALALGLMSCGKMMKGKSDKKMAQQDSALAHSWKAECASADVLQLTHTRRKISLNMLGNFDKTESFYGSAGCDKSYLNYKVSGTYATLGPSAHNADINSVNFTINKATITVFNQGTVEVMNRLEFCGKKDWKVSDEINVTNKKCKGLAVKRGDVIFDVYEVKDNTLFLGKKFFFLSTDEAPSDRPDSVASEVPYSRD